MTRRAGRAPLSGLAILALVVLAACGDGGGSAAGPGGATLTPTTLAPTAPVTSALSTRTTDPTDAGSPTPYLAVPDGVRLTDPGTRVSFDDPAVVAWSPRQDVVGVLRLKVTRVEQTTVSAALTGFDLTRRQSASTPYLVHLKATNDGAAVLGGLAPPVYATSSTGGLIEATGVPASFSTCRPDVLEAPFVVGADAKLCLLYLVPRGATLASVAFVPGADIAPVTWEGRVDKPGAEHGRQHGRHHRRQHGRQHGAEKGRRHRGG